MVTVYCCITIYTDESYMDLKEYGFMVQIGARDRFFHCVSSTFLFHCYYTVGRPLLGGECIYFGR
jgi:hypothetical protein